MTKVIVLKTYPELDYELIYHNVANSVCPFVCAWLPVHKNNEVSWAQGHYFSDIENAIDYMKGLRKERLHDLRKPKK